MLSFSEIVVHWFGFDGDGVSIAWIEFFLEPFMNHLCFLAMLRADSQRINCLSALAFVQFCSDAYLSARSFRWAALKDSLDF